MENKMDFEYKMVIVTREDLDLSPGKLAAQVAHAAVSCALSTKKNNSKLLKELSAVVPAKRKAHFCCDLVLAKSGKIIKVFFGRLSGHIHTHSEGINGFGYDPVFYLAKYKKTVAQLPLSLKNKISHRAKAFGKLKTYLNKNQYAV